MSASTARGVLVPVGESVTIRNTVAYVARELTDDSVESAERPVVHFVYPTSWQRETSGQAAIEEAEEFLERVETWVREDLDIDDEDTSPIELVTEVIGTDQYLFSPRDYAEVLLEYARYHGLEHVVLDPELKPGANAPLLTPLAAELELSEDVSYEEAPVDRAVGGRRLFERAAGVGTFATLFGISFLFYQLIGGFGGPIDYVTGGASALLVAAVLSGITFERPIKIRRTVPTTLRWLVYLPYLFWEITKANLEVAYMVLHPSLPIEPRMEQFRPAVNTGLQVTTLANSITLTPGTITVDVREQDFYIHTLTQSARDSLYAGGLERATRFVFYGKRGARIPSPRERGQQEGVEGSNDAEPDASGQSVIDGGDESR